MGNVEWAFAARVFGLGVQITLALALGAVVYLLATPDGPNRGWLLLVCGLTVADALVVHRLPRQRIIERGRATAVWGVWNLSHVVGIAAAAWLDGPHSPFVGLLWVSVAFAAVSLPGRYVAAITAVNAVALSTVSVLHAPDAGVAWSSLMLQCVALAVTAVVCWTLAADRRRQVLTLQHHNSEIVRRLALVVEHRDRDTGGHVERIGSYTAIIADELGLSATDCEELRLASTLHDVGKVGIADAILLKPGALTDDERSEMQRHAEIGAEMLTGSGMSVLDVAAEIALSHHEWFDGSGYPRGLAGEAIPLNGRMVAVADVFDALTSDRVYKPAMSFDAAREIVEGGAGTQFDAAVVAAFVRRIDEVREVHAELQPHTESAASVPVLAAA